MHEFAILIIQELNISIIFNIRIPIRNSCLSAALIVVGVNNVIWRKVIVSDELSFWN